MFDKICFYFILFIIYSIIGWSIEVIGKLMEKGKFINRGFLVGPICPIYGYGCLAMILTLSKYKSEPLILFLMAIIICSALEYFTSYLMEKLFHVRWWDYTNKKYNINGRICAETMIPFGLLGCLVIYTINPLFTTVLSKVQPFTLNIVAVIIFFIYLVDNVVSLSIMFGFKGTLKTIEKDGTEEISKKVRAILKNRNFLYKRLINAFPNITNSKERLEMLQRKISKDLEKIKSLKRK